jgi:hypothetical protein
MSKDRGTKIIHVANTKRAMALTPAINRLTFDDADEVRALFSPPNTLVGGNPARVIRSVAA